MVETELSRTTSPAIPAKGGLPVDAVSTATNRPPPDPQRGSPSTPPLKRRLIHINPSA